VAHEAQLREVESGRGPTAHEILGAPETPRARGERGGHPCRGGGGGRVATFQADRFSLVLNG